MTSDQPTLLKGLDYLLMGAGGIVLIAVAWRWRRRGGGDPLLGSPIRANRLHPLAVWFCLGVYVLGTGLGLAIGKMMVPAGMDKASAEAWTGVVASAVTQLLLISTCLAVAAKSFHTGLRGFGLGSPPRCGRVSAAGWVAGGWLAGLCCTGLVAMAVQWLIHIVWTGYQPPDHGVFTTLRSGDVTVMMRFLTIAGAAVLAPVGEECLFRGILQTALKRAVPPRRSMYHRWFAIILTAVIFGLMHSGTPQFIPSLILLAIIFGYIYERTGSLRITIAIHMLFNIKSLLWYHLQTWT